MLQQQQQQRLSSWNARPLRPMLLYRQGDGRHEAWRAVRQATNQSSSRQWQATCEGLGQ
jgi:hypothetical protein